MRRMLALGLVLLGGCSGMGTNYGPIGLKGGYKEAQVSPGVWRVVGSGNGFSGEGFGRHMAMYRSAELMKAAGFSHVQIIDQQGKVRYMGQRGAPATNYVGEDFILFVRGANSPDSPSECRAKVPTACFTYPVEETMARLRPVLRIK
nr:hypothetical protein [uncultured Sphingosinicella sp.]